MISPNRDTAEFLGLGFHKTLIMWYGNTSDTRNTSDSDRSNTTKSRLFAKMVTGDNRVVPIDFGAVVFEYWFR